MSGSHQLLVLMQTTEALCALDSSSVKPGFMAAIHGLLATLK